MGKTIYRAAMERVIERRQFSYTAHIPERRKAVELPKKEREKVRSWCWKKENREFVLLAGRLQREGFDVKAIIKDALKGEVKDREHYRMERGRA